MEEECKQRVEDAIDQWVQMFEVGVEQGETVTVREEDGHLVFESAAVFMKDSKGVELSSGSEPACGAASSSSEFSGGAA